MALECVVLLFFYKLPNTYLPKTYIRPVLMSLLTIFCIIFSTWLYNIYL